MSFGPSSEFKTIVPLPVFSFSDSLYCHVDMDAFFVSAEISRNSFLRGKPVVVGGGAGERLGVVAAASYEARSYGIFSGTPIGKAKSLCSDLIVIHPDFDFYSNLSNRIMNTMREVSPDVQELSVDEAVVDITGVLRLWKSPMNIADRIKRLIKENTGLPCTIGIARFPVLAKMCSKMAKPDGILFAIQGQEERLLFDHDISDIPGVGRALSKQFRYFGINTIGQFCKKEPLKWEKMLLTRTVPNLYPKSVSAAMTLDKDCDNRNEVIKTLSFLCSKCGTKLRKYGLTAKYISVVVRYSDFSSFSSHIRIEGLMYDNDIQFYGKKLFKEADSDSLSVRLVGVRLGEFSPYQGLPVVYDKKIVKNAKVHNVMDKIRIKYNGVDKILFGS